MNTEVAIELCSTFCKTDKQTVSAMHSYVVPMLTKEMRELTEAALIGRKGGMPDHADELFSDADNIAGAISNFRRRLAESCAP